MSAVKFEEGTVFKRGLAWRLWFKKAEGMVVFWGFFGGFFFKEHGRAILWKEW